MIEAYVKSVVWLNCFFFEKYNLYLLLIIYLIFYFIYIWNMSNEDFKLFNCIIASMSIMFRVISLNIYYKVTYSNYNDILYVYEAELRRTETCLITAWLFAVFMLFSIDEPVRFVFLCTIKVSLYFYFIFLEEFFLTVLHDFLNGVITEDGKGNLVFTDYNSDNYHAMREEERLFFVRFVRKNEIVNPFVGLGEIDRWLYERISATMKYKMDYICELIFENLSFKKQVETFSELRKVAFSENDNLDNFFTASFYMRKFYMVMYYVDDNLLYKNSVFFLFYIPWFFYSFSEMTNFVPSNFVIEVYVLFFCLGLFAYMLMGVLYFETTIKDLSYTIADNLFFASLGTFLFYCVIFLSDGPYYMVNTNFLNGFYMYSYSVFFFKFWIFFFFSLTIFLAKMYIKQSSNSLLEMPILFMFSIIILLFITGLSDIFAIILCFEILSIIIIGLCGLSMSRYGIEAAVKYFVQNVIITGIIMIGVFFNYLFFKNSNLLVIATFLEYIYENNILNVLINFSLLLWIQGFFFKLGIFPVNFHVADLYTGSSSPVVFFLSALLKPSVLFLFITKVVALIKISSLINVICCFCLASIIFGEVMALQSDHIKRFFGYASISQYGFFVLSLLSSFSSGVVFFIYAYLLVYNISLFFILAVLTEHRDFYLNDVTSDLSFGDLNLWLKYNYLLKLLITLCFIFMSGLPPFVLFFYKYEVFLEIFYAKNFIYLLVILVSNIISFTYYFKILANIWFFDSSNTNFINASFKKNWSFENKLFSNSLNMYISIFLLVLCMYLLCNYFDFIYVHLNIAVVLDEIHCFSAS